MSATRKAIIYGRTSGIVRRVVVPDDDQQDLRLHLGLGEAMLIVPRNEIDTPDAATALVAQVTGKTIPSAVCAVVNDAGEVVQVIMADPELDKFDGHLLVRLSGKSGVGIGWRYDGIADAFTRDGQTIWRVDP